MSNFSELPARYDASIVEQKWYQRWEEAALFKPEQNSNKKTYTIVIPPPNITGSLHMGHAICYPLQDLLGRYWRLQGKNVWIIPGQDHAGISTQSVVEKQLRKEGTSGAILGREKFIERVWEWRKESGDTILNQLKRLGCAFDWSSSRFTFDEEYHEAVLKVFVDWFNRGLIYRGNRVVNWDPALQTSVSDIETERRIIKGKLYYIKYEISGSNGKEYVTIATTRPETIFADVAIAVNPEDKRYTRLVGKSVFIPLIDRPIPIIADSYTDPNFGTGALKITPAHDANDFEVGQRHQLPMPVILDTKGYMNSNGGKYAGLNRNEARKRIVADLESSDLLEKIEDYEIPLVVSERSGEVIEPLLSEQWFVNQRELAKQAIEVVENRQVKFVPERYEKVYLDWMNNVRDWCISRQLWWGHRIPIYYTDSGKAIAAISLKEAQQKAGSEKIVRQDEDVLDTWFSSGLWPFELLGWPNQDLKKSERYPTSVLVTDRNIIYLWVARMIMMSLDIVKEVPFHEVFIYATVLTEDGKRMSKSLGTGIDPMEVIPEIGADALRFALLSHTGHNQEIRYSNKKTEESRNFCNKIWNAGRFILMNLEGYSNEKPKQFELVDQWLLSRLAKTEDVVKKSYEKYDIQAAAQVLYTFFWSELCDWYIEISKSRLQDPTQRNTPQWVLAKALETFLILIHPIMPHITEEIYSYLPIENKSLFLMSAKWPDLTRDFDYRESEATVERWFAITRGLRALRAEVDITPLHKIPEIYIEGDLGHGEAIIKSQGWTDNIVPGLPQNKKYISTTVEGVDIHLPIEGLVDSEKELSRLNKDEEKISTELNKLELLLNNPMFLERAKAEVVEREKQTAQELRDKLQKVHQRKLLFQK